MTMNRKHTTTALLAAACVTLGAAAPFAMADKPEGVPNGPKTTTTSPATTTPTTPTTPAEPTPAEKKKGYGVLCKGQSKKHVKGQKGTPFSQCVTAMAKIDKGKTTSPSKACKSLSKKRAEGQKRSPYQLCKKAAAAQVEKTQQAS